MRRAARPKRSVVALVVATATAVSACGNEDTPSVLRPESDAAERVEGIWWLTFAISVLVVAFVTAFVLVAARRGRRPGAEGVDKRPVPWGNRFIVIAGLVISGIILAGTFAVSLGALDALSAPPSDADLTIEVVARNWWWEVRYPNGAVTANEIHIPVGRPVEVRLATADVIHSFWVPQLQVKKDNIPGMDNRLWLVADQPGRYRGQCAEYCGLQHARMAFFVVADPPAEFDQWLAREAAPAPAPGTVEAARGRDVFLRSSCVGCHTIRGTTTAGAFGADLGPDLTHVASRETIGAGVLPLTPENLSEFVQNAQHAKPGASMPPTEVSGDELRALVAYLMERE